MLQGKSGNVLCHSALLKFLIIRMDVFVSTRPIIGTTKVTPCKSDMVEMNQDSSEYSATRDRRSIHCSGLEDIIATCETR